MSWSKDYKKSIDCKNPKGFSQKAHCAARKKRQRGEETKSMSPFNEDVQSVKKIKFSKFTHKTPHLKGGQHVLDPNVDLKQLVHHATVQYLDRDADGDIDIYDAASRKTPDENVMSAPGEAQKRSLKLIAKQKGEMLHTKRGSAFESVEMRYCKLCRKMEARTDCSYGPTMWDKYSVAKVHPANEAKDHEYSMARSELSTIVKAAKRLQKKMKKGEGNIEAWVQSKITKAADYIDTAADYVDSGEMNEEKSKCGEGEYWCKTDKKCKPIPKGHHVMPNGNLMKDDEHEESGDVSEAKRDGKSAKDKDYSLRDWFKGGGWVQAGGKYDGKPCAKQPGQKTKPFCRDADDRASMSKEERNRRAAKKRKEDPNPNRSGKANFVTAEQVDATKYGGPDKLLQRLIPKGEKIIPSTPKKSANLEKAHFEPQGEQLDELWGKVAIGAGAAALPYIMSRMKPAVDKAINEPTPRSETLVDKLKQRRDAVNKALEKNSYQPEGELIDEKKDACYSKVKSRYKVWPSAYASGALVKCRKVGAANWGTKSESTESLGYDWDTPIRERADRYCPKCQKMELRSECRYGPRYWDMFSVPSELINSKKDYGITMPYAYSENVKETYQFSNWRDEFFPTEIETVDIIKPEPIKGVQEDKDPCWVGYKQVGMKKKGKRMVPNCVKEGYSNWREELSEDWQKVNRKDKTDGLSQAAVDAYRRENPGSKLQTAVTEKKPKGKRAKRRANFCRRMKGMKSKLTSAKTARDPDSRINKALRRWRCN